LVASLTNPAKLSTTMRKKYGDSGSPYLKSLVRLISFVGVSLTNIDINIDPIEA